MKKDQWNNELSAGDWIAWSGRSWSWVAIGKIHHINHNGTVMVQVWNADSAMLNDRIGPVYASGIVKIAAPFIKSTIKQ